MSIDREKLKSLQFNAKGRSRPKSRVNSDGTRTSEILDEDDGRKMAETREHGSGRVDVTAFPKQARMGVKGSM